MANNNETIDKLEKLKSFLIQLTSAKTKLESEGVIFEFTGELNEGTEVKFLEGSAEELTLEDGRVLKFDNNIVSEIELNNDNEEVELESNESESTENFEEHENEDEMEGGEEDEDMQEDEESDEDSEEDEPIEVEERINQLEGLVGELTARLDSIEAEHAEIIESLTSTVEENVEMKAQIEKLSKSPAVTSIKKETTQSPNKTKLNSRAAQILAS